MDVIFRATMEILYCFWQVPDAALTLRQISHHISVQSPRSKEEEVPSPDFILVISLFIYHRHLQKDVSYSGSKIQLCFIHALLSHGGRKKANLSTQHHPGTLISS